MEPPTTTSGIPATIEKVEARKVEYKQKQEDAKRAPPPKPAAPAANGNHKVGDYPPPEVTGLWAFRAVAHPRLAAADPSG